MASASERFVIAYNGEIYNHMDLRSEMAACGAAPQWRGHSDTETLLAGFEHWGIAETLRRTVGMFAIALWDARERTLHLARDRFGEKPQYYGWSQGAFLFGSELKALRAWPGFSNALCEQALSEYFRFLSVPAPRSIYRDIYKLPPGALLTVRGAAPRHGPTEPLRPGDSHGTVSLRSWWSLDELVSSSIKQPYGDVNEGLAALETSLSAAVKLQSLADVPLGAFLSGGIDSSLIVALMQEQSSRPVRTFTIGFNEAAFDESRHAARVAAHLGTDHSQMIVTAAEAQDLVTSLPRIYDEPFADSSQIATHLVCRAARRHVTVALSGDGGDELFGGYNRYFWAPHIWHRVGWMPYALRQGMADCLEGPAPSTWDLVLRRAQVVRPGEKLHKLGRALRSTRSVDDLYTNLAGDTGSGALLRRDPHSAREHLPVPAGLLDSRARMMYWDSLGYLPDDILCKVDRAAMAVSLETRVPFLDHRVAEAAWRLPMSMKVRGREGKWALRQLLYRRVPRELIERPKSGFALPVGEWLRGPLRPWAEALLETRRIESSGTLDPAKVRETWSQHLSGKHDRTSRLWSILMFQSWLNETS